ncbi:uncharacterized protein [Heptranchias perlo]|uniref:uncharacterized protein n=1 Tax=Heptranchias perlo TaxID=212740 RepID=UPI00355A67F8
MAEEKKLKLKRKRVTAQPRRELNPNPRLTDLIAQTGSLPQNDPPRKQPGAERKELPSAVSTWLEDDDLNETDHIWALLIRSVYPDTKVSDWKTVSVPDLPPSPDKTPKSTEPVATETFSVGKDLFTWIPFPPACKAVALEARRKSQPYPSWGDDAAGQGAVMDATEPQTGRSQLSLSEMEWHEDIFSSIDATNCPVFTKESDNRWAKGYLGNVKPEDVFGADPTRIFTVHAASKHTKSYPVDERHGRGHMRADVIHSPVVSLQRNEREPKQSVPELQSNPKPHNGKTKQHKMATGGTLCAVKDDVDIITGEHQDHSFTAGGLCATSELSAEGAVNKWRPDSQAEGRLELESCPMCLVRFPAGFTLLEVDSHLAKCLSESTEDVIW